MSKGVSAKVSNHFLIIIFGKIPDGFQFNITYFIYFKTVALKKY